MAITASDKRRLLEDAWDLTETGKKLSLRDQLRELEKSAGLILQGGSQEQISANGRTTKFFAHGVGQITSLDMAQAYRELIDLFDDSKRFLKFCAAYGLGAFTAYLNGVTNPDQATNWQQFYTSAGDPNGVTTHGTLPAQCWDTVNQLTWVWDGGEIGNTGWH